MQSKLGRAETDGKFTTGYLDANICGYPTDSDIIKLVLLAIYFIFITISSTKYSSLIKHIFKQA